MATPAFAQVVLAEVLDPQGRNAKIRPVVIVTADAEIAQGAKLIGVAISRSYGGLDPADYVTLPWHRSGHPLTGLKDDSAAICKWLIALEHVVSVRGRVPDLKMQEIMTKVGQLPP